MAELCHTTRLSPRALAGADGSLLRRYQPTNAKARGALQELEESRRHEHGISARPIDEDSTAVRTRRARQIEPEIAAIIGNRYPVNGELIPSANQQRTQVVPDGGLAVTVRRNQPKDLQTREKCSAITQEECAVLVRKLKSVPPLHIRNQVGGCGTTAISLLKQGTNLR